MSVITEAMPTPYSMPRMLYVLRGIVAFAANLYAIGLLIYLALRVLIENPPWWLALLHNFAPLYFLPLVLLIPLVMLARLRGSLVRLLLLAVIGGLWFGPYFLPKTHATPTGPTLKIATLNIYPYNTHIDDAAAWLKTTDADVILIQELNTPQVEPLRAALKETYPHQTDVLIGPLVGEGFGNAIFSRLPLLSYTGFDLEDDGNPAHQRVTVRVGDQTIAIHNVHLLMPVGEVDHIPFPAFMNKLDFVARYDSSVRNAEIQRLLDKLEVEPLPYLVAGDFNMSDQALVYGKLAARMGDSFREAGTGFGMSWPAGESEELPDMWPPLLRLDYIWHSDQLRAVEAVQGPELGSDHLPLVATLELVSS